MTSLNRELEQLKELLEEGVKLFDEVINVEEQLQDYIIKGDHSGVLESQDQRDSLEGRLTSFEQKGLELVPEGTEIGVFVTQKATGETREQLLNLYYSVNGRLSRITALQGINKSLLEEKVRFTKEMQRVLQPQQELYNNKGRLNDDRSKKTININKTC